MPGDDGASLGRRQPWQRRRARVAAVNDTDTGAVVYLIDGSKESLEKFYVSLSHLEDNFCRYYGMGQLYPVILFMEGCIDDGLLVALQKFAPSCRLQWNNIEKEFRHIPPHANRAANEFKVSNPKKQGYANMIRWYFRGLFEHPAVRRLDYVIRFDTDSALLSPFYRNPVHEMRAAAKRYGYYCACVEGKEWVNGLHKFTAGFVRDHNIVSNWTLGGKRWEPRGEDPVSMPYNNFEIVDVKWWLSEEVQEFVDAIDNRLGIFLHRWGDAPLRGLAISMYLKPVDLRFFGEIRYAHPLDASIIPKEFIHLDAPAVSAGFIPKDFSQNGICETEMGGASEVVVPVSLRIRKQILSPCVVEASSP